MRRLGAHRRRAVSVALGVVLAGLAGCSAWQPLPQVDRKVPPQDAALLSAPYRLQIGDQLDIRFRHNPELDDTATVQPDGRFQLRLAPDVVASGKTLIELTKELNEQYSAELEDPGVTVILRTALPLRFYVGGEVVTPGEFLVLGPPLTLVQAIARDSLAFEIVDQYENAYEVAAVLRKTVPNVLRRSGWFHSLSGKIQRMQGRS